jgi:aminopeptidase N
MFDGHSYNKGGRILHMLRNHLGDEAFFAGVKNYLEKNKFKPAEFHQLRLAFEEVSGQDLNWFFNQWFLGAGHPVMNFNHEVDTATNTVTVSVEQVQDLELSPIYRIPMEMAIYDDKGKHEFKVVVDELEETFTFPYTGSVKGIIYDDQFMLLGSINEEKSLEQYVYQYYNGERFYARRDGLMKGSNLRTDEGQKLVLDALSDDFWHIRELAASRVKKLKGDFEDQAIAKLKDIVKNDPKSDVRQAALKTLAKELDDEELKPILVDRIENDRSYSVVSSALSAYGKLDPDKAVALAEGLEKERSSKMMFGISQIYAGFGDSTKYDFFTNALNGNIVQGFDKLGLMSSFTYYLTRMEPEYMGKAIDVYADLAENGGFYMKMFAPQNLSYLLKDLDKKKAAEEDILSEHENNNDAAYADQSRKKIAMIDDLITRYSELAQQLQE